MSIMLENNLIEQVVSGGFLPRNKVMASFLSTKDRSPVGRKVIQDEKENGSVLDPCSSSSSSSIGMNSDDDNDDDDINFDKNDEAESKLKNSTFDSSVDALEQALPIRRGISKFYNGKSKSFASLADAACSSIKDITKQENAYSRKRKNLLAYSLLYDKGRTPACRSPSIGGGIAKRLASSKRYTLAVAVAMNSCDNHTDGHSSVTEVNGMNNSRSPSSSPSPPETPIPPPPWRSYSLVDLQHCAVNSNLSSPLMGSRTKPDEVS